MKRLFFATLLFAAFAALASGQPTTPGPLASEQLKLFKSNRELLEDLVSRSVDLANANDPLTRAKACQKATADIGRAMGTAVRADDADRVAELGEYLTALMDQGLTPTLTDARRQNPVGSPGEVELVQFHERATLEAEQLELSIPALGRIGTSARVKDARAKLHTAREALGKVGQ